MNTLLICLCVGQLACVGALVWMGYHAIQEWKAADWAFYGLVRYMEAHDMEVPSAEELEDYINDREDNA